jgi:hypothetical protein
MNGQAIAFFQSPRVQSLLSGHAGLFSGPSLGVIEALLIALVLAPDPLPDDGVEGTTNWRRHLL